MPGITLATHFKIYKAFDIKNFDITAIEPPSLVGGPDFKIERMAIAPHGEAPSPSHT